MDVARPGGRVLSIGFDISKYVTISIFYIFFIATKVRVVEMREVSENEGRQGEEGRTKVLHCVISQILFVYVCFSL